MKSHPAWISFLLMASVCHAAEIVAWKVPLTQFAHRGLQSDGIVRRESAPEASPFFKPGDELWDLKGIPSGQGNGNQRLDTDPALEWVIWNAGSRRLVSKGEWAAIWQLYHKLNVDQLPRLCRLTAEVFAVPADGSPLSDQSTPLSSLSWICRSGNNYNASRNDELGSIQVEGSATADTYSTFVDLKIGAVVELHGHERMQMTSSATIFSGGCNRSPKNVVILLDGNGTARLTSRSGQMALLTRSINEGKITRSLQIEPTIGENDYLIDLRIDFQNGLKPSPAQAIQTSVTLHTDTWLELLSGNPADTSKFAPIRVKAEIKSPLE